MVLCRCQRDSDRGPPSAILQGRIRGGYLGDAFGGIAFCQSDPDHPGWHLVAFLEFGDLAGCADHCHDRHTDFAGRRYRGDARTGCGTAPLSSRRYCGLERLGIALCAFDEAFLVLFRGADVEDEGLLCECLHHLRLVEFTETAAGIVDEIAVAVDLLRLADEIGHIEHGADLRVVMELLPALELAESDAAPVRVADLVNRRGRQNDTM